MPIPSHVQTGFLNIGVGSFYKHCPRMQYWSRSCARGFDGSSCHGRNWSCSSGSDNDNGSVPAPSMGRVIRLIDSGATTCNGADSSNFYQYARQEVVDAIGVFEMRDDTGANADHLIDLAEVN